MWIASNAQVVLADDFIFLFMIPLGTSSETPSEILIGPIVKFSLICDTAIDRNAISVWPTQFESYDKKHFLVEIYMKSV